ncbi:hypothetical protein GMMP1_1230007 [Candidatus Magnetomoraceae bacterium gMMP-1]
MGQIITFYSYKGGTGRSMALANVAVLLAQWGYRVLIADWDIEAPGLEHFFTHKYKDKELLDLNTVNQKMGIIDILIDMENSEKNTGVWRDLLVEISLPESSKTLHMLTAGKKDDQYIKKVRNFDFNSFYFQKKGGDSIESLRNEWKKDYDFVFIDSRTGVTDIGGVCTIQLPDLEILLFTATEQSFNGIVNIARKADKAQQNWPVDRLRLAFIPIASRIDQKQDKDVKKWIDRFSKKLSDIYANWLPKLEYKDVIETTQIPYSAYFSFGEKLAVLEQSPNAPGGLTRAYQTLAALIANNLDNVELIIKNRDKFIRIASERHKKLDLDKPPRGTMDPESEFYIERQADEECWKYLSQDYAVTIALQGTKQSGKSSLMQKMLYRAEKERNIKTVFIDFRGFTEQVFEDEKKFFQEFCLKVSDALGALNIPEAINKYWKTDLSTNVANCDKYISQYIISNINKPFILALDEPQLITNRSIRNNFFGMLRTWHNKRAGNKNFARMTLFITSPTDPNRFIYNPNISPFNVAEVIMLEDFTLSQAKELNRCYQESLKNTQVKELYNLLAGQPYLTHISLYSLKKLDIKFDKLIIEAKSDTDLSKDHLDRLWNLIAESKSNTDPFKDLLDHLNRLWNLIKQTSEVKEFMLQIFKNQNPPENDLFYHLKEIGLIKKDKSKVVFRNKLYEFYYKELLSV